MDRWRWTGRFIPEYECTGGSSNPAHRACPHLPSPKTNNDEENKGDDGDDDTTAGHQRLLHINMPSFRDPLCPRTLFYLFTKAVRPEKKRVRILQQNVPEEDDDCLAKYCVMMLLYAKDDSTRGGDGDELSALAGRVLTKIGDNVEREDDNNNGQGCSRTNLCTWTRQ